MITRRLLLLLLALAPGAAWIAVGQSPTDRAKVRQALDAWVAMWNRYDLDEVDRRFVADSTVTYFSSERGGLIRGIEALRRHHADFGFVPGGKETGNRLWLEDVQTGWHGTVAVVTATWHFARSGAAGPPQRGPVTFVVILRRGEARIAHAHFANARLSG
jgi:ketosteroid isomerase-like protein